MLTSIPFSKSNSFNVTLDTDRVTTSATQYIENITADINYSYASIEVKFQSFSYTVISHDASRITTRIALQVGENSDVDRRTFAIPSGNTGMIAFSVIVASSSLINSRKIQLLVAQDNAESYGARIAYNGTYTMTGFYRL